MKKIAFFNLNRITYQGGAENYIIDIGNKFLESGQEFVYIGDFRIFLRIFIIIGFVLGNISFSECKKLLSEVGKYPVKDNRVNFPVEVINAGIFLPFSAFRKKIGSLTQKCDAMLVKNELIDMLLFRLLIPKSKKNYCVIFTSIRYPEANTFRAKVHNFFYLGIIYESLLKKYDGLIVSNKADEELLISHFGIERKKIKYIPYGIDLNKFKSEKEDWKIPRIVEEKRKILFVGRLEEQKGVDDLVDIIKEKNKEENNYQFIIVGDGPSKEKIIDLSKEYGNIIYLGSQPHSKVLCIYEIADLVIIPSHWETFCYVALEAQLSGKPVLCYDIPGPNEIVIDGVSGKIVSSQKEFSDHLDDEYEFDARHFAYNFSLEKVIEKYAEII
ncbi:MAG: glycosyltransferase family 4 protein [Candidatus Moranbacteria bacterium]|nr:glycosyltransferase family 4 protein [Candidatus Moranbacteria bacterium]